MHPHAECLRKLGAVMKIYNKVYPENKICVPVYFYSVNAKTHQQ